MYNSLTRFNVSLRLLKKSFAPGGIDLSNTVHRASLLKWLNDWGCRHLSKKSHEIASSAILNWYKQGGEKLFPTGKAIWETSDHDIARVITEYDSLKSRTGACPIRGGKKLRVDIGPTAASKILFAIRPESLMPWDEAMRKKSGYDGRKESYFKFLLEIRRLALRIGDLCKANDFDISQLPHKIGRSDSTVLELINEYLWVTVTRRCKLPPAQTLNTWLNGGY